ncbi:asparagine synthase (glutamine-hydrolyzing) [bacterium]|nr:asparagine synthase (glutamine-hydrolyzing) [Chloroflexi bacterium CFX6]RIL09291.1 MAG: asparagine synthase (glutamine-hydrolyzing) [bacterium]
MCGIFGFAGFDEPGALARMGDVIRHRGPDDDGFFETGDVHLGMRRLSIIDIAGGRQPVSNEDGSVVVVYNGEIYNYVELRAQLEARGHRFHTDSDTEIVVHAFEEHGHDCLRHFHGMFAFALYDRRTGELFVARDRVGMKPLYYWHSGGRLAFASEIKALLQSAHVPRRCHPAMLDSYLALRYVPNPASLFEDIHVLPAAHCLTWRAGQVTRRRWWDVTLGSGPYAPDAEYLEAFDTTFTGSVRRHLRSDVPVGAYLSGGIDSSAIVALMARELGRVKTFSIGFNAPNDETAQARDLAGRLGCEHTEITCLPEHFSLLPRMVWHLERPIGDALILAYYLLARETSRHVKVVLAGEGADELFGGYAFHKVIQWVDRYARVVPDAVDQRLTVPLIRRLPVDVLDRFFVFPAHLGREGRAKVADYLAGYRRNSLYANYVGLRTLFGPADRAALYSPAFRAAVAQHDHLAGHRETNGAVGDRGTPARSDRGPAPALLDRLLALQLDDWLQDFALLRQDKSSMAHGLELRLPFLDPPMMDLAFRMPPHLKVRGFTDKYVERKWAERILPPENTRRSKNPFYLPMEYFHGHPAIRGLIDRTLNPDQVRRRGYFDPARVQALVDGMATREFLIVKQVMALVILELWHQVFIDRLGPD